MRIFAPRTMRSAVIIGLAMVCLSSAWAQRELPDETQAKRGAWQPDKLDRSAYRDIVDFNIFLADRKSLAEQVDRQRNPPDPAKPEPVATETEIEETPPDPDSLWRLSGISRDQNKTIAFIEHVESGELSRISEPAPFSLGEITTIGYDGIIYVVNDEERMVRVGESLLGQRVMPTASGAATADGSAKTTGDQPTSGSAADRLRQLRERREREQGNRP